MGIGLSMLICRHNLLNKESVKANLDRNTIQNEPIDAVDLPPDSPPYLHGVHVHRLGALVLVWRVVRSGNAKAAEHLDWVRESGGVGGDWR